MAYFTEKNLRGYHFKLYPELKQFVEATKSLSSQNFWEFIPHFKALAASPFINNFLSVQSQKMDETFDYDILNQDVGIDLMKMPEYTITLGKLFEDSLFEGNRPEVVGYGSDMIFCNLGPGTLSVEIYETPATQQFDVFDKSQQPTLKKRQQQKPGELIALRAGHDIIKIVDTDQDTFQLYMVSTHIIDQVWHYNENTLEPLYSTAGHARTSRIQMAMMTLARMGSTKALPILKKLAMAKEHFIRWDAIKIMLAIEPEQGKSYLQAATEDCHPHVRNAALKTLARWSELS